jgi:molybdenum-dependent DNA-binding transcriptional regulator ModE
VTARLTLRIDFDDGRRLGPGKIALLEAIAAHASIAAAGRAHAMSYRRAWLLVDELNGMFDSPLVATRPGGVNGGRRRADRARPHHRRALPRRRTQDARRRDGRRRAHRGSAGEGGVRARVGN